MLETNFIFISSFYCSNKSFSISLVFSHALCRILSIYLFNNLFMSVWIHRCLFHYLVITYFFFFCPNCFNFGHWRPFQMVSFVLLKYLINFFFVYFCTFILCGTTRCSRLILHFVSLDFESDISPKDPIFFRNQEGGATGISQFRGSHKENTCIYTSPHKCTRLNLFLYLLMG